MQRQFAFFSGVWVMNIYKLYRITLLLSFLLIILTIGCVGPVQDLKTYSWNLSPDGKIRFTVPEVEVRETVSEDTKNLTVTDLTFKGFSGDVHAILVSPHNPVAVLVWAPGANNPASGYQEYMKFYPVHNIAVLIMDIRGNGGLTPGYPMDIEQDAGLFLKGELPQYYLIAIDMISAKQYIRKHYPSVPVYSAGDSNGGRYAALAAGADKEFSGYIGISTSGFQLIGNQYEQPLKEFLLSIDPEIQVSEITPRPVIIFHAPNDPVIPFKDGQALAGSAGDNATFIPFNGSHGGNREVDNHIISFLLNSSPLSSI